MKKLFPPYLNQGSRGKAVRFLQYLLMARYPDLGILPDGDFTPNGKTAAGVVRLQKEINLSLIEQGERGIEEDGNFGPITRKRFKVLTGIDVDVIEQDVQWGE